VTLREALVPLKPIGPMTYGQYRCKLKHRFITEAEANRAASRSALKGQLRCYRCTWCGCWHHSGKRNAEEKQVARERYLAKFFRGRA
jgi:hypothetical protein